MIISLIIIIKYILFELGMEDSKISMSAVNFWYQTSRNITKLR